jgi:hypothetical protein
MSTEFQHYARSAFGRTRASAASTARSLQDKCGSGVARAAPRPHARARVPLRPGRLPRDYEHHPEHHEAMVYWGTVFINTTVPRANGDGPPGSLGSFPSCTSNPSGMRSERTWTNHEIFVNSEVA